MKTVIIGDLHGNFENLEAIVKYNEDVGLILQVGDFGCWKHLSNQILNLNKVLADNDVMLHWCDGNHEEFPFLHKNKLVTSNIVYQPRGTTMTLQDGRVVLFMGGADSIDKYSRTIGYDWFPDDEHITVRDLDKLPDVDVDIVISHTAPDYFDTHLDTTLHFKGIDLTTYSDPSCIALDTVYDRYKPKKWYFGHFHKFEKGKHDDCEWTMLSHSKAYHISDFFSVLGE